MLRRCTLIGVALLLMCKSTHSMSFNFPKESDLKALHEEILKENAKALLTQQLGTLLCDMAKAQGQLFAGRDQCSILEWIRKSPEACDIQTYRLADILWFAARSGNWEVAEAALSLPHAQEISQGSVEEIMQVAAFGMQEFFKAYWPSLSEK
jgi:hypothetical protein